MPLSLLASMPAGNVAGLIDLEGEPAEAYGGGEDGAGGEVGSGSERVARLSDAVAGTVALPWACRSRLAAGRVLVAHWKVDISYVCLVDVSCERFIWPLISHDGPNMRHAILSSRGSWRSY